MIKIFCQYSYGGFKTLHIEGKEKELLDKEVTIDEPYGFPTEANVYFRFGGAKMVYRQLQDGHLTLVVREIPSIHKDGDGRALSCAVQFISDASDRNTLDNMAIIIANDLAGFGTFFANLFSGRGGLHIQGDELRKFIDDCSGEKVIIGNAIRPLENVGSKKSGVFLFIPLSAVFGKDSVVTKRVCNELRLDIRDLKGVTVSMARILQEQKAITIKSSESATIVQDKPISREQGETIPSEPLEEQSSNSEPAEVSSPSHNDAVQETGIDSPQYAKDMERLIETLSLYKKVIMGLSLLCIILLITCLSTCSGGK